MDLQDCLNHYEETGDTMFEIQEYGDSPIQGYIMQIKSDGTYWFYDAHDNFAMLNESDPLWLELEHSINWYRW
jgi:hypothetical protein